MNRIRALIVVALALVLVVAAAAFFFSPKGVLAVSAGTAAMAGMSFAGFHNVGAFVKALRAAANTAVTAGGSGDATEVTGVIIDRLAHGNPLSVLFGISYTATLAATKTLSIAYTIEHGDDAALGDAADYKDVATAVQATGATGGSTEAGCLNIPVDLGGAKRYFRLLFTPDMSATATDTAALSAVAVLGGEDRVPAI